MNELVQIKNLIYEIRGYKVMIDSDLADLYEIETKALNQAVKRNPTSFPANFMFQLTKEEYQEILRCKNFTSSWGGTRHLPYAFTEQGVYMLMTVLKGEIAVKQSKALIRIFKSMKDYIIENKDLLNNNANILKIVNIVKVCNLLSIVIF